MNEQLRNDVVDRVAAATQANRDVVMDAVVVVEERFIQDGDIYTDDDVVEAALTLIATTVHIERLAR